jgi:DNA-binding NtrC family response regulator
MSPKRVLVVDDDAAIRETFERNLSRWGYAVTTAASAEAALSAVHQADPALVMTDVRMSGMTGLELLALLRERSPDVDVVVITAYEDMRTAVNAMKAGAYDYLVKPLDLDHIEVVLQRCFAHRALRRRARQLAIEAGDSYGLDSITGRDPRMIEIYKCVGQLARSRAPVLIRGETGTGKELIARAIHFNSSEADQPFVAVNCAAIPEPLLESELFGHRKGAFTGAIADRRGRFAIASQGTIFLDEIGDTSGTFQAKLLRVLQDREFTPVGAENVERTDARVVAATHRDLEGLTQSGGFREDLYFRLRVVEIHVPPLRDRPGDIPILAEHFVRRASRALQYADVALTPAALTMLMAHSWPGNVRELENALMRAVVLARGGVVDAGDLMLGGPAGAASASESPVDDSLAATERRHVRQVLAKTGGNKRKAARLLRVSRARLDRLIQRHGLEETGLRTGPGLGRGGHEASHESR